MLIAVSSFYSITIVECCASLLTDRKIDKANHQGPVLHDIASDNSRKKSIELINGTLSIMKVTVIPGSVTIIDDGLHGAQ